MRTIHNLAKKGETDKIAGLADAVLFDKLSDYYINSTESEQQHTPLFCAVFYGHADTVRVLLKRGADVTIPSKQGLTALHIVVWKLTNKELSVAETENLFTIVELLLKNNPDLLQTRDIKEYTPLDYSVAKPEVKKRLNEIISGLHIANKTTPANTLSMFFATLWGNVTEAIAPKYTKLKPPSSPPPL